MCNRPFPILFQFIASAYLGVLLATSASADEWKTFQAPDKGFSVDVPAEPEFEQLIQNHENRTTYLHRVRRGNTSFVLALKVFKDERNEPSAEQLEELCKTSADFVNGVITETTPIKIQGKYAGREFLVKVDGAAGEKLYRWRLFFVGNRQYEIFVAGPGESRSSADAARFLDSLKVVEK